MAISTTTKALKDIMRVDAGVNGDAQYIEQITWLLFLKAFDFKEQEWEMTEDDYYPVIPEEYRWRNWAENSEGLTGDALLTHVNNMFLAFRNMDFENDPKNRKWLVHSVMEDVNNFLKSGTILRQLINKINQGIDLYSMPGTHLFGDLYETMLKDLQSAGKSGEFYTPRAVTHFVVEQVAPKLGETVLDPATGTGGFLSAVIDSLIAKTPDEYRLLQSTIRGIEKKPLPYLLCVTNLISHGVDVPNIKHDNTLRTPTSDYTANNKVDVIVTNPPFGGAEEKAIANSVPAHLRSSETADMFLVHIVALLKEQGRCGLVLPDGILFGDGVKASIKKHLLEQCNLHTIIRLPKSVFAPYTGINTNLLFFTKGLPTKEIWFYRLEMPSTHKNFSKTKPMDKTHFEPVREWWNKRIESDVSKLVGIDEIIANNYNLDFCGFPHESEEVLPPEELISQYQTKKAETNAQIENLLLEISAMLNHKE